MNAQMILTFYVIYLLKFAFDWIFCRQVKIKDLIERGISQVRPQVAWLLNTLYNINYASINQCFSCCFISTNCLDGHTSANSNCLVVRCKQLDHCSKQFAAIQQFSIFRCDHIDCNHIKHFVLNLGRFYFRNIFKLWNKIRFMGFTRWTRCVLNSKYNPERPQSPSLCTDLPLQLLPRQIASHRSFHDHHLLID